MVTHTFSTKELGAFFDPFQRASVGFDTLFDTIAQFPQHQTANQYPHYNIIKTDDESFTIELAIAGFSKDEVDISLDDSVLSIKGDRNINEDDTKTFIHQGIATRRFEKKFTLAEFVEVESADFQDGILSINFVKIVPEAKKPKKIIIGGGSRMNEKMKSEPQTLSE